MMSAQHCELSKEQAYAAMYDFLNEYWKLSRSEELGILLGSLALLEDDRPADPALWEDWCRSVEKIVHK